MGPGGKFVIKFLVVLCLGFKMSVAQASSSELVADFYKNSLYNLEPGSKLNFEKFNSLLQSYDLRSVEDTLETLSSLYPEFFANYILMYHSRSLQTSSFEYPRAILFDRSGHFVFSFNGNPQHRGFYNLELMHFIPEERRFEFREVTFSGDGSKPPRISEANPAKCMACHQSPSRATNDPRPNWEPYNIWPGAYGSLNGTLTPDSRALNQASQKGLEEEMVQKAALEKTKFDYYDQRVRPDHPRYKWLNPHFRAKNTTEFTEIIAAPTALRAGRLMSEMDPELLEHLKYPLLGVMRCGKLMVSPDKYEWLKNSLAEMGRQASVSPSTYGESIHPVTLLRQIDKKFDGIYKDAILRPQIEKMKTEYLEEAKRQQREFHGVNISNGLNFLLEPFGVSTHDWSMDFHTEGNLAFSERFGVPGYPHKTMRMGYRAAFGDWEGDQMCIEIGLKSEKAFNAFFQSPAFKKFIEAREIEFTKQNQPLINRCIKCHSSGDYSVPQIPFDNESQLAFALKQRAIFSPRTLLDDIKHRTGPFAEAHERMPLGLNPTPHQVQTLISYLESLN